MSAKFILGSFLSFTLLIFSCTKSPANNTQGNISDMIIGTWPFQSQSTRSLAYPSTFLPGSTLSPIGTSSWIGLDENISLAFNADGTYNFFNNQLPTDIGTYQIIDDSLIVFNPDTSALIKFCYSLPAVYTFRGKVESRLPHYSNFTFTSDTVSFLIYTDNSYQLLIMGTAWIAKADSPILPSNDTLVFNQLNNYFRKDL